MPTGKVKWFDGERAWGSIADARGGGVSRPAGGRPAGATPPKPGTRVEFGVADGRRGPSALSVTVLDPAPSVARGQRRPAEDMAVIVEDLIKQLDGIGNGLRHGRYPDRDKGAKTAASLRAVAGPREA